jgi:hypothetical protein
MRALDMNIQNIQVDSNFCDGRRRRKREKDPKKSRTLDT